MNHENGWDFFVKFTGSELEAARIVKLMEKAVVSEIIIKQQKLPMRKRFQRIFEVAKALRKIKKVA